MGVKADEKGTQGLSETRRNHCHVKKKPVWEMKPDFHLSAYSQKHAT